MTRNYLHFKSDFECLALEYQDRIIKIGLLILFGRATLSLDKFPASSSRNYLPGACLSGTGLPDDFELARKYSGGRQDWSGIDDT
jgi:hypothetical protein